MTYKILALGGGGSKGILHVGVIKAIEERNLNIEEVYGCSIGAAYAIAFAFGLKSDALTRMSGMFSSFNGIFFDNLTVASLQETICKKGFFDIKNMERVFLEMFDSEGIDLRGKKISDAKIPLKICATNLTKKRLTVFSGSVSVMKAFLASACIPLLFCPQEINGSLYIDGGFLTNIILNFIPEQDREKTFSVSIIHDEPNLTPTNLEQSSILDYIYSLYKVHCLHEHAKYPYSNNLDLRYNLHSGISDVGDKEREEMISQGYESACSFLSKRGL